MIYVNQENKQSVLFCFIRVGNNIIIKSPRKKNILVSLKEKMESFLT